MADLDAAERFYTGVLGFHVHSKAEGRHLFFRLDSQMLLIFNPEATLIPTASGARIPMPPHGASGHGHVCFGASGDDISTWAARLKNAGVVIEVDFEWPGGGRSIYFRDPDGNCLEIAEPRIWGME